MYLSCKILFADVRKRNAQLAQLVEQRTENPRVSGSIPELGIFYGALAQSVEHLTFNQVVRGSNPRCLIQGNPEKLGFSYIMKDFEQNKKNAGKKRVHLGNCYREFSRQISDVLLRGKVVK